MKRSNFPREKPRPRLGKVMIWAFLEELFSSSSYYLRGFVLLFKEKNCCKSGDRLLQKYHSGTGKAGMSPRMGLSGVGFSSTSREEITLFPGCRVHYLQAILWRNYNEKTSYVHGGRRSGPCCCRPGESRRHQAGPGGPLQGLRHLDQSGYAPGYQ